ncbi:hypothetical protein Tco_1314357 [Tanacetum coccineum]
MKKLKENVHAIQVGCQNCGGAHLNKDCPLNEEIKSIEETKYGEFRRTSPFSNGAKYRVDPPVYYTRIDNRPPLGEKRPSLEELMNKHLEESTRRRAEMEEWENHNPRLKDYPFKDWLLTKVGHINVSEPVKKTLLKTWLIDCFREDLVKDPRERSFDDYKWMFDLKIDQLAEEYELGIGKKGHMLDDIWENCKKVQGDNTYWWHDQKSEEEERRELGIYIEEVNGCLTIGKRERGKIQGYDPKGSRQWKEDP